MGWGSGGGEVFDMIRVVIDSAKDTELKTIKRGKGGL